jgi:hypothetical protein
MNSYEGYSYVGVDPKQAVPSAIIKFVNKRKYRPWVLIARLEDVDKFKPVVHRYGLSLEVGIPQPMAFWLGYVVVRRPVKYTKARTPVEE